jgi:hypothetical protein
MLERHPNPEQDLLLEHDHFVWLRPNMDETKANWSEMNKLRKERDQARREVKELRQILANDGRFAELKQSRDRSEADGDRHLWLT